MAIIDTYRNNITRNRNEFAKLSQNRARESAKIAPLKNKIIKAEKAISTTSSSSIVKSKLNHVQSISKLLATIDKNIAGIYCKMVK